MDENLITNTESIKNKIVYIRGKYVILDKDIAKLYGVEVKYLKRQIKRNILRFPDNFMFEITKEELNSLRCQNVTSKKGRGGIRYLPYAFTEYGVSMLSSVLRSNKAIEISIKIIEAFVDMHHFLIQNAEVFQRLDNVERTQIEYQIKTDENFNKVFQAIEENYITPKQGIFFDGQVFDAHKFVSDLVKTARKNIVLIDNYIDENVLVLLSNKEKGVNAVIYTSNISEALILAKDKFNKQYGNLEIRKFSKSHDRFLIIDNQNYHIGASMKDLGKKWFSFNKINIDISKNIEADFLFE